MNKRIQQLAKQAYEDVIKHTPSFLVTKELYEQKFAELIVRECAKVAWYHTPDTEELEYSHLIEDKILKHFGVEE